MPENYQQGLKEIVRIDPENASAFIEELKKVSPDFAEYFVGFAFGKIYSRPLLEPKFKELIAIANLTASGHSKSHLKLRILGAIRTGCSKEEITEVIIQSIIYIGFMKAITALSLVKDAFEEHGLNVKAKSPNS